jgi:hypothetical protein
MMEIAQTEMKKQNLPESIVQHSMNRMPRLKRWHLSPSEIKVSNAVSLA